MFITKKQACQKHEFLTQNLLKNILYKNINGFREKVVHKVGRKIFLNEQALLQFFQDSKER